MTKLKNIKIWPKTSFTCIHKWWHFLNEFNANALTVAQITCYVSQKTQHKCTLNCFCNIHVHESKYSEY